MYQTLLQSERRVDDPNKADIIFVYDYCRLMWALSEEHAEHHWWASENLKKKLTGTGGPALVSAYNVMTQVSEDTKILALVMSTDPTELQAAWKKPLCLAVFILIL